MDYLNGKNMKDTGRSCSLIMPLSNHSILNHADKVNQSVVFKSRNNFANLSLPEVRNNLSAQDKNEDEDLKMNDKLLH